MNLYRPSYHFVPEKNWMNDPNGVIYYKGEYHLFYQYNPDDYHWGNLHWGHAKSKDLVHWNHLPIALYPSRDKGELHCFSGCAVVNGNEPVIFYTSIGEGNRNPSVGAEQWMAISKDDMLTWEKYENNPVLTLRLHGKTDIKEWRDPFVWKENDYWFMVLGGSHNRKGCALIYRSSDLKRWEFLNILCEGEEEVWECPNCFKLGDKYVIVYSPGDKVRYLIGNINSEFRFEAESKGTIDHSGFEGFYAPNSLTDISGRRIMIGWLTDVSRGDFRGCDGWSGVQSIPRILSMSGSKLIMKPAKELEVLRKNHKEYKDINITEYWMPEIKGRALEMILETEIMDDKTSFSLDVLCSEDNSEKTSIVCNQNLVSIDRTNSSLSNLCHNSVLSTGISLDKGEVLRLHVFIDHSTVEVFINYKECISTRVYPTREDSENIRISLLKGDSLKIKSFNVWEMNSIWN